MGIQDLPYSTVAQRLDKLAELYKHGQASELMIRTLDKLLAYESDVSQEQLEALQIDLTTFEQKYDLSSAEFFECYKSGQTDDRMDFIEWASIMQMAQNLQNRLTNRVYFEE